MDTSAVRNVWTSGAVPRSSAFKEGVRDGLPIALGYFAVSFSLGIAARKAGLSIMQGIVASLLNNASAGEYAGFTSIGEDAPYLEIALITLVANARYLLMSTSLSQKFSPDTPLWVRFSIGYDVTDELFGLYVNQKGDLTPRYAFSAMAVVIPAWAIGTGLGIYAGEVLPVRLVSALSVSLYGMFLAIVIPPARKDRVVGILVVLSFLSSWVMSRLPLSSGTTTIILTVVLSALAAFFAPVKENGDEAA